MGIKASLAYATSIHGLGKHNLALAVREEALGVIQANWGHDSEWVAYASQQLGESYYALGRFAEAREFHRLAIEGYRRLFGPDSTKALTVTHALANDLAALGEIGEATRVAQEAVVVTIQALHDFEPVMVALDTALGYLSGAI
jgi:tetratricopeptide (TPR) repeat protein